MRNIFIDSGVSIVIYRFSSVFAQNIFGIYTGRCAIQPFSAGWRADGLRGISHTGELFSGYLSCRGAVFVQAGIDIKEARFYRRHGQRHIAA
jgi:hypothetical protein